MFETIVGGIVSGVVLWILAEFWENKALIKSPKIMFRLFLSIILGFFIGGAISKTIEFYTHQTILIKSWEAFSLILVGILLIWSILSNFKWLKA